ncbi:hypothetical protein OG389_06050 [Streptomyces sp. NBC_00435]|uniref:hypothetical protein n=1 Tax=Streptomyces sp. NBC_00435 TaxID=2903649 RepID=UPI002E1CF737
MPYKADIARVKARLEAIMEATPKQRGLASRSGPGKSLISHPLLAEASRAETDLRGFYKLQRDYERDTAGVETDTTAPPESDWQGP